jgi:hypothetical protein
VVSKFAFTKWVASYRSIWVCVDNGLQHWDTVYINHDQLAGLLAAGACFASVVTQGPEAGLYTLDSVGP